MNKNLLYKCNTCENVLITSVKINHFHCSLCKTGQFIFSRKLLDYYTKTHNGGRFETSTTTKIHVDGKVFSGSLLKVTLYETDNCISETYKFRPHCIICGKHVGCFCYNDQNSENPEQRAYEAFDKTWLCENNDNCIIEYLKQNNPDEYNRLFIKYNGNIENMIEDLTEQAEINSDDYEGDYC